MKTILISFLIGFMMFAHTSNGQNETNKENDPEVIVKSPDGSNPYYVLKVEGKTLEIGKGLLGKIKLDDINPDWISSIQVLKGDQAIKKYGEKSTDGVVEITFKELKILSNEIQNLFKEVNKD